MSKLRTLRSQLASLRGRRQAYRWLIGLSAAAIAVLWVLVGIFVLDVIFQLDVLQRAVVIVVGLLGIVWAAYKFSSPFFGIDESLEEMALLVERQQGIDSDLVAALQFESPDAKAWGSAELEDAVINYVAELDRGLNVFEGFSHEQVVRRMLTLGVTAAIVAVGVALAPGYVAVFFNRLALGNQHYPTSTNIERIAVNEHDVLIRTTHGTAPADANAAEGRPVLFAVWASNAANKQPPREGLANLVSSSGVRKVPLQAIEQVDLEAAQQAISTASGAPESNGHPGNGHPGQSKQSSKPLSAEKSRGETAQLLASITSLDSLKLDEALADPVAGSETLQLANRRVASLLEAWPESKSTLYVGRLPRLLDEVRYKVYLGDAWTDPAAITMIPLPVVVPYFNDVPPEYARASNGIEEDDPTSLQRSVIEGSQVEVRLESTKPLKNATLTVFDPQAKPPQREFPLTKQADDRNWQLAETTPLANVTGPLRFEIQVTDHDHLQLETPLRGYIRLKADRPPRITGTLVHRAVLPSARPEIEIRASDDYGLSGVAVRVEVTRGPRRLAEEVSEGSSKASFDVVSRLPLRGNKTPKEAEQREASPIKYPLRGDALPLVGAYVLDMSALKVEKGDEIRITLEATDYRGDNLPGTASESEPLVLTITDESGILAAVSEGDRRSQEQIDDLIRRQLGIGEAP